VTRQRVSTALPPRERELLAELVAKVKGLVEHVGLSLGWETLLLRSAPDGEALCRRLH
jgi:hypothetical protein